jgi:hypothetical protein
MDTLFATIERSALSTWIRESLSIFAFPGILTLHTLGLACLAGPLAAIDLRLLGVARRLPIAPLQRFFQVAWCGFWVSAATGVALVIAYPAKALTNPLFFVKLLCVELALWASRRVEIIVRAAAPTTTEIASGRLPAAASLLLWTAAIVSGRLLAYTYTRLLAS